MSRSVPLPDYLRQPPAWFHTRILVGPGAALTPRFISTYTITHVINCAFDEDSPMWFRLAYLDRYACMEAQDSPLHNILSWYPLFEAYMKKFLRESHGVVYVHCQAGMNRSAFLALAYVCKHFSMIPEDMIPRLQQQRPCMFQNVVYRNQVKDFINGYLQSTQNPGNVDKRNDIGDTRLRSSGNHSESARVDVDTGVITPGTQ